MVSDAELVLEEERGPIAPELALRHDGLAVRQHVGLVHEVGRQEDHLEERGGRKRRNDEGGRRVDVKIEAKNEGSFLRGDRYIG